MAAIMKAIRWTFIAGALCLAAGVLYIITSEAYLYLTRSERRAEAAAQELFARLCVRRGLDPRSFGGPTRPSVQSDSKLNSYTFVWARAPEETVTISVTYLPYDLPYSISEGITDPKPKLTPHS